MSGPWWRDGVLYEIYPRSFADSNRDGIGNGNRRGVVLVSVVEGRDLASLTVRLADCAESVHAALLDSDYASSIR